VFEPLRDKVEQFSGEKELVPGLTAIPAAGHTPGHTVFVVTSGEGRHLVWSDTTNKPELFARNPTWQVQFDMDGDAAAAVRLRLLDMAATERMTVGGYHFPFPAVGHIAKSGQAFDYVPTFWRAA
jgi:glyoxylase-like metal-dependent hydrolase (beta-lactamase superfamily II)